MPAITKSLRVLCSQNKTLQYPKSPMPCSRYSPQIQLHICKYPAKLQRNSRLHDQLGTVLLDRLAVRVNRGPLLALGESVERQSVGGNRVRNKLCITVSKCVLCHKLMAFDRKTYLGVHLPRSVVQVVQVVADLVVAWVEPLSGMATKHLFLLLGLDGFCTSGNSTSRNASADEAVIVATAVKGNYRGVNLRSKCDVGDADRNILKV